MGSPPATRLFAEELKGGAKTSFGSLGTRQKIVNLTVAHT